MEVLENNIYPIFDRMLGREDKEALLGQRGVMVWFTGLSGSGKSTIAIALERELHKRGLLCRIAEVGKLFVDTGVITIAAFISPNNELREMASAIIGKADFLEVYVSTPLAECERRDVKGLYAKARKGEIKEFTGVSAPFEAPERPDLSLDTSVLSVEQSVNRLLELIVPKVEIKH